MSHKGFCLVDNASMKFYHANGKIPRPMIESWGTPAAIPSRVHEVPDFDASETIDIT